MNNLLLLLSLASTLLSIMVSAHMEMVKPAPIRWVGNPNTITPNYDIKSPLQRNGTNFPCQGFTDLFNTTEGASVESWEAGSTQTFIINGTATHSGGSCQVSISEDDGVTFKVLKSIIGGCPVSMNVYSFNVPKETKDGKVIFAWTWFSNTHASPEMYMNCAAVTITGTGGNGLSSYPDMFVADVGNGCSTPEGDIVFPNPGKNVDQADSNSLIAPMGGSACSPASTPVSSTSTSSASVSASAATGSHQSTLAALGGPTATTTPGGAAATTTAAANPSYTPASIQRSILLAALLIVFSSFSWLFCL